MNTSNPAIRTNLDEVSFIRPILIILMVLYHALCIHTGNWRILEGMTVIPVYRELGRLAYSFMLESFVFVSGYVWAYQRETRGKKEGFLLLCKKKALRLVVPYLLFGVFYMLLFMRHETGILGVIEGSSHLWFLLMLFWCFLIGWCIMQLKLSPKIVISVLYLICLVRPVGLPLRLSYTMYYLPFFFWGYYMYGYYDWLKERVNTWHLAAVWGLFILTYGGSYFANNNLPIGWRGGAILYSDICNIGYNGTTINCNLHYEQKAIEELVSEGRKPLYGSIHIPTVHPTGSKLSYSTPCSRTWLGITMVGILYSSSPLSCPYLCNKVEQGW